MDGPTIISLNSDLNKQSAQLLSSWPVQRVTVVILLPNSVTESCIKDNFKGNDSKYLIVWMSQPDRIIDFELPAVKR